MRIVILEYVFAGGLANHELGVTLVREARQMVTGLVEDITRVPGLEPRVVTTPALVDQLPARELAILPEPGEEPAAFWRRATLSGDAVIPVAPETGGALETLTHLLLETGVPVLGSRPTAVRLAGSKYRTAATLTAAGIGVVPTLRPGSAPISRAGDWIIKPDDGADCQGVRRINAVQARLLARPGMVLQPLLPGRPASLCLFCDGQGARVLSCNRQIIRRRGDGFRYYGSRVAGIEPLPAHHWLATAVHEAIPGLYGFVGIDFLADGDRLTVMEVNPRLTTSFAGLRPATGISLGALIAELMAVRRMSEQREGSP